jgi:low affinity Fe/Cu permease
MSDTFRKVAHRTSEIVGTPAVFLLALMVIVAWVISGPYFGFSDTWQLVINTGTTIVTFLMVFLIQNTQNRDTLATQLKLDELLRAIATARTELVDLEELSDDQLETLRRQFRELHDRFAGESELRRGRSGPRP